jgi:hypothetical protein
MVPKPFTRTTNNLANLRVNYSWPAMFCAAAANWVLSGAMYSEHSCSNIVSTWFKDKQMLITVKCINQ